MADFSIEEYAGIITFLEGIGYGILPESNSALDMGVWFMNPLHRRLFWRYADQQQGLLKSYRYLMTFTLKPSLHGDNDSYEQAEKYIKDQVHREALGILEYYYIKELTKKGTPHWHVAISTSKPLKKNRVQYYEKKFGHVDLSRTKGQTLQEALNYMSKEGQPIKLK